MWITFQSIGKYSYPVTTCHHMIDIEYFKIEIFIEFNHITIQPCQILVPPDFFVKNRFQKKTVYITSNLVISLKKRLINVTFATSRIFEIII